jgi:hypothetical protein
MLIGASIMLAAGLACCSRGRLRQALLISLAGAGVASAVVILSARWQNLANLVGLNFPTATRMVRADLPRLSRMSSPQRPGVQYLDLDHERSVTGIKLPSKTPDRTRVLNASGADLMVDLPPRKTSWSFVTPVERPTRIAKVPVSVWADPGSLFDSVQVSSLAAVSSPGEATAAPEDLSVIQVRGGRSSWPVMPGKMTHNNEALADVLDIPQRRPPADPESNVFLFETAEGTQGLLRIGGVTFEGGDRDGLSTEHIVFTDRFIAEIAKGTPENYRAWVGIGGLHKPELFVEQGGYVRGARGVDGPDVSIDKSGLKLTQEDIDEIAHTIDLKVLVLTDSSISDDDLAEFRDLHSLASAEFNSTLADTTHKPRITDAGLEHIARWKNLKRLQLVGLPITDDGLRQLVHLSELRSLQLGGTKVRGKGLTGLRNLDWLRMDATPVQDDDLQHIARLENLEQLYLDSTDISDAGLRHLPGMKRLRTLNVYGTKVTAEGVAWLEVKMPGITIGWDGKQ